MKGEEVKVSEIDAHDLHVNEHIAFMLSEEFEKACEKNKTIEDKFLKHINNHKDVLKKEQV